MTELAISLGIAVGLNILLFIPAYFYRTDKLTDLSYALSFAVVAATLFLMGEQTLTSGVLLIMILLWAFRLGTYLFIRIRKMKKDSRFDDIRHDFFRFGRFFVLQGVSVAIILLPTTLYMDMPSTQGILLSYIGLFVFLGGLLCESLADLQKYRFINRTQGQQWIETGLWKYSRHPNYLGEILVWIGIYLYTVSAFNGLEILLGLVSPLYIAFIIIFVTGIPLLERSAESKWGGDPAFRAYKSRTAKLIPFIW